MSDLLITKDLSFSYGHNKVLDNINITIPKGSVYGYLGRNGAGKTTTINLFLKLLPIKSGDIFYSGTDILLLSHTYFKSLGVILQPASMYKHLTPYEQLKYLSMYYNINTATIDYVLELVNLEKQKNKKIKHLSAGMKQKLAIAMALIHDPEFLIFDEPTNGLDPNSIIEFRNLIQNLSMSGKTVFISSHIIGEIEKCCTHIGILDAGKLILQDSLHNLHLIYGDKVNIRTSDIYKTKAVLDGSRIEYFVKDGFFQFIVHSDFEFSRLLNVIIENKIDIYDIKRHDTSLESLYLQLTK